MQLFPRFHFFSYATVLALGLLTAAGLVADILRPRQLLVVDDHIPFAKADQACLSAIFGPVRTELRTICALARSMQALASKNSDGNRSNDEAQQIVRETLAYAPLDSKLWLALALLQLQVRQPNSGAVKMSYLSGANADDIAPMRLKAVVSSDVLADPDLRALAAGDIRIILIHRPDTAHLIVEAYKQANGAGKTFIEDRVGVFDAALLASLRQIQ
jgi:hypothetical protein